MHLYRPGSTLGILCLLGAITLAPARADVIFTLGNNPQPGEQNILLNTGETGTTVTGETNMTHDVVAFSSTTNTLTEPTSGPARIEAVGGAINNISIKLPGGGTYSNLIFNPNIGDVNGTPGGTATVTVVTTDAVSHPFGYILSNGQNFLTITTSAGELISSTTIDYALGFSDLRQIRISGISSVPAPSVLLTALLGAVPGLGGWRVAACAVACAPDPFICPFSRLPEHPGLFCAFLLRATAQRKDFVAHESASMHLY